MRPRNPWPAKTPPCWAGLRKRQMSRLISRSLTDPSSRNNTPPRHRLPQSVNAGNTIPAGGLELGVARHRGGFIPIAFRPDARPIRLAASTATFTGAEAKLRLILRGIRLAEEGR